MQGAPFGPLRCYTDVMSDRVFLSALALAALIMIGVAMVWPQGQRASQPADHPTAARAPS